MTNSRPPRGRRTLLDDLSSSWHTLPEASWLGAAAVAAYQAVLLLALPGRQPGASTVAAAVLAAAAVALLLVRRRWPLLVLVAALVVPWLGQVGHVPPSYLFLPSLAAFYTVMARATPLHQGIGAIVAAASIVGGDLVHFQLSGTRISAIPVLTVLATSAALALAMRARREGFAHAADQARAAREEQRLVRERDSARRRARIVGDLHDSVGHNLTAVIALTEGIRGDITDRTVAEAIDTINTLARDSLDDTRRTVAALHPDRQTDNPQSDEVCEHVGAEHGWDDLDLLLVTVRRAGLQVTFTETGPRPDDRGLGELVYTLAREALTNTMRHAPAATRASIMLDHHPGSSDLTITDDAPPPSRPPAAPDGTGLRHLRDLVHEAGGNLHAGPTANGWRLSATLPHQKRP